jgi:hypothetical protein
MEAARAALAGCSGWPEGRCQTGKRMYKTRRDALANKRDKEHRVSMANRGIRFDPYHCKECDWWHLASRETA